MKKQFISPKGVHHPTRYSHAVRVENTVYVAGQVGLDEKGKIVEGGFERQAIRAFENLKMVLEAAGASLEDVVKLNGYIRNFHENFSIYHEIRSRYFSKPLPAATHIEVPALAFPEFLLEVEAVAVVD